MKVFKLEICEQGDYGESDFVVGIYSSKELAEKAFTLYCNLYNKATISDNAITGDNWPMYEENHYSHISEFELDDFSWEKDF